MWIYNLTKGKNHHIDTVGIYRELANKKNRTEEEFILLALIVYRSVERITSTICEKDREKYCYKRSSDKSYMEGLLRNKRETDGFYSICLDLSDKYSKELEEKKQNKEEIEDYKMFFIELFKTLNMGVFDMKYNYYKDEFLAEVERKMKNIIEDFELTDIGIGSDI